MAGKFSFLFFFFRLNLSATSWFFEHIMMYLARLWDMGEVREVIKHCTLVLEPQVIPMA